MFITLKEAGISLAVENLQKITGPLGQKSSDRALKACGYYFQQQLKDYGREHSSSLWMRNNPHSKILKTTKRDGRTKPYKRKVRHYKSKAKRGMIIPRKARSVKPMTKIVNAARYKFNDTTHSVEIGFVGTAKGLAGTVAAMAVPANIPITPKMRKYLWGIGFPLKAGTKWLHRPARPWVEPVYNMRKDDIAWLYEVKFISALKHYGVSFE